MALRNLPVGHQALIRLEFAKNKSLSDLICSGIDYGQTQATRVLGTLQAAVGIVDWIPWWTSTTLDGVQVESGRGTQDDS